MLINNIIGVGGKMIKAVILCFAILILTVILLSCEKNYITQAPEEHVGDYDLLYIHAGGGWDDPLHSLKYSTKTGEVIDTIKTPYVIADLQFTKDGTKAVMSIWEQKTGAPSVLAVNYPLMDTIGILEGIAGEKIYFSPDEQEVITCWGPTIAILSFPDLSPIFVDTVANYEGGFLTSNDSAFYLVSGVDSIFVIDYTDRKNVTITAQIIGSSSGAGAVPGPCAVDFENEQIIIVMNYDNEYSYIHVLNSNDISLIQQLFVNRLYNGTPGIRPGGDEIYLKLSGLLGDYDNHYIDIYNFSSNTLRTYINLKDIAFNGVHIIDQLEFTRDGRELYVLMGSNQYYPFVVLGFNLDNDEIVHYLLPETAANGNLVRINPIDKSN